MKSSFFIALIAFVVGGGLGYWYAGQQIGKNVSLTQEKQVMFDTQSVSLCDQTQNISADKCSPFLDYCKNKKDSDPILDSRREDPDSHSKWW